MHTQAQIIRNTPQRQIILEELASVTSHPTASELHQMVQSRLPHIGLGTVYRNLEIMAEMGMIRKLELGGHQKRFDANTSNHAHIRCSVCGRLDDFEEEPLDAALLAAVARDSSYQILGHNVEFSGICPECRDRNRAADIRSTP